MAGIEDFLAQATASSAENPVLSTSKKPKGSNEEPGNVTKPSEAFYDTSDKEPENAEVGFKRL